MIDPREIAKWHLAHQGIFALDESLVAVAPFPSLYASDFAVYLEAKGGDQQVVSFIVDVKREIAWAYDNWAKAQRDADPGKLIEDMLNNCAADQHYAPIRRFLTDYAKANGIGLRSDVAAKPSWMEAIEPPPAGAVPMAEGTGAGTAVAAALPSMDEAERERLDGPTGADGMTDSERQAVEFTRAQGGGAAAARAGTGTETIT